MQENKWPSPGRYDDERERVAGARPSETNRADEECPPPELKTTNRTKCVSVVWTTRRRVERTAAMPTRRRRTEDDELNRRFPPTDLQCTCHGDLRLDRGGCRATVAPDGRVRAVPKARGIASNHDDVDTLSAVTGPMCRAI
jgi:hypothetical protein